MARFVEGPRRATAGVPVAPGCEAVSKLPFGSTTAAGDC